MVPASHLAQLRIELQRDFEDLKSQLGLQLEAAALRAQERVDALLLVSLNTIV